MPDDRKPAAEAAPPQKGDGLLKAIYWTVGVLAVLVLLGALWVRHVDAEHQRILREAREAVEALRVEPVPDEDNAARVYEKAFAALPMPATDYGTLGGRLACFEIDIGSEEVAKLLAENAQILDLLSQGAGKPKCVFVTDYSAGYKTEGFALGDARAAGLLLDFAARRATRDGKSREVAGRLCQTFCLARGVGQPRFLINGMISHAVESTALTGLRDILTQTEPDAESLQALLGILAEHTARRPTYGYSLHGERLIGMLHAAEVIASPAWRLTPRGFTGLSLRDARTCEKMWDWAEETLERPTHEAFQAGLKADHTKLMESLGLPYSLTMPAFRIRACFEDIGLLRCARLAVACRLHRLRTGALPAELKELAGYFPDDWEEVSTDPFTGKPMLYKHSETGFTVYSVGAWDTSDNGAPNPYASDREPDLAFPVDRRLWEDYRAKMLQCLQRMKNALKPKTPSRSGRSPSNRGER